MFDSLPHGPSNPFTSMSLPHSHLSQLILLEYTWEYFLENIPGCQEDSHRVYHGIWKEEVKHRSTILFLAPPLLAELSVAIPARSVLSAIGITKNLCYDGQ